MTLILFRMVLKNWQKIIFWFILYIVPGTHGALVMAEMVEPLKFKFLNLRFHTFVSVLSFLFFAVPVQFLEVKLLKKYSIENEISCPLGHTLHLVTLGRYAHEFKFTLKKTFKKQTKMIRVGDTQKRWCRCRCRCSLHLNLLLHLDTT